MTDLFSPTGSVGVVSASILVSTLAHKAFATPALLFDPERRDWFHAFAAAVLSTAATIVVLLTSVYGSGDLLSGLGAALVVNVVIVGLVYRSLTAGVALVIGVNAATFALAITVIVDPLAPAVLMILWGLWLLERDRVGQRSSRRLKSFL